MDREARLDDLPGIYPEAHRMAEAGAGLDEIAAALGIDRAAVPAAITLAKAKLEAAEREGESDATS